MTDAETHTIAEDIAGTDDQQLDLLATHRRRLAHQLRRQALLGEVGTPPELAIDIEDARASIAQIKAALRAAGKVVDDLPDDLAGTVPRRALALSNQERRNRSRMLAKVRLFWVKGVLERSLHGGALIDLGVEYRPDAVAFRWAEQLQLPEPTESVCLAPAKIADIFDEYGGDVLILGAPGAGKTTLLLDLTRTLVERAEQDEILPMPVVFHLSSWARRRQPLVEWLIDELNAKYDVPHAVAKIWVANDQVLPLLDGLDEVEAGAREACAEAINYFRQNHGLLPLVVCSRIAEYEALTVRLQLQGAILIRPLSQSQVDAYLASTGPDLAPLQTALQQDPVLRELAETPLLLHIMAVVYQTLPVTKLGELSTLEERRRLLFDAYVEQMFERRGAEKHYSPEQIRTTLAWLAQMMIQRSQTIFFVERLQPNWLPEQKTCRWYTITDRLVGALVIGAIYATGFALISYFLRLWPAMENNLWPAMGVAIGISCASIVGLFGGEDAKPISQGGLKRVPPNTVVGGLIVGLISSLSIIPFSSALGLELGNIIGEGLFCAMIGVLVGLVAGGASVRQRRVVVAETLQWSWARALRLALGGVIMGGAVGTISALFVLPNNVLMAALLGGSMTGLVSGLVGGLASGEVAQRVAPNQGIRRSARNAILIGMPVTLISSLCAYLILRFGIHTNPMLTGFGSIMNGLLSGVAAALVFGGYACLSHLALRLVLWRSGALPLRLVAFLDHCAEHILMRKVGGGYIFVHRLLLEYFADLEIPS